MKNKIQILILNITLICLSIVLYNTYTKTDISRTENGNEILNYLFLILIIVSTFILITIKKTRTYGVGILCIFSSVIIFLFIYINKNLSTKSEFESFKQLGMLTIVHNKTHFSTVKINENKIKTKVDINKCFLFDSVELKVRNGFLGYKYYTDEIKISESFFCEYKNKNIDNEPFIIGVNLIKKRCFSSAIKHYSYLIEKEPLNDDWLFYKGLVYLFRNDYKNALSNFLIGITINTQVNNNEFISKKESQILVNSIIKNLKKNTIKNNLIHKIHKLDKYSKRQDYKECIDFCILKLNLK